MSNGRDERARRGENRARQRTLTRERSQPATWRLGWMARPAERSAHQVSTAHFQAAYPAIAEPGLGSRGVYIGRDLHGGSFVYDPWVLYAAGQVPPGRYKDLPVGFGTNVLDDSTPPDFNFAGSRWEPLKHDDDADDDWSETADEILEKVRRGRVALGRITA